MTDNDPPRIFDKLSSEIVRRIDAKSPETDEDEEPEMTPEEIERENAEWRREIAREEGMLNGIDSYNDWME